MKFTERKHNKSMVPIARTLRKNMTKEERRLWYTFLRVYPIKFLRQKPIGNYVADFYSPKAKLIIELDGSQHYEPKNMQSDSKRTAFFEQYGIKVIRIPNNYLNENLKGACEYIDNVVKLRIEE